MTVHHSENVLHIIRSQLDSQDVLTAAYLFGSYAEGKAHALSDIDVALLFRRGMSREERLRQMLSIGAMLDDALPLSVDLVDLDEASPLLRFQVLKHGKLLLEFDRTDRCLFEMRAMQIYYDLKPYIEYQQAETVRRIREQGLGHGYKGNRSALDEARRLRQALARAADRTVG